MTNFLTISLILCAQMSHSSFPPSPSISHRCSFAEAEGTSADWHGLMTHHTDNDRPRAQLQSQHLNPPELTVLLRTTAITEVAHPDPLRCYPVTVPRQLLQHVPSTSSQSNLVFTARERVTDVTLQHALCDDSKVQLE